MSFQPTVTVIIISFNTKDITLKCLESLFAYTKKLDFELIVVDNGSTDGSPEVLHQYLKNKAHTSLIINNKNVGFGAANNQAAQKSSGRYLLFLNSDTLLFENAIARIAKLLNSDPEIIAASCRLLNEDRSNQPSGGYFPNLTRVFAWQLFLDDLPVISRHFHSIHPKPEKVDSALTLDWITGAFFMVRKVDFEVVGGFDPDIFMYAEELELCFRLKKLGGKIILDPDTAIIHLGGASGGGRLNSISVVGEIKGILHFFRKHKKPWQFNIARIIFKFGSLLRLFVFGIILGNVRARRIYQEAFKLAA